MVSIEVLDKVVDKLHLLDFFPDVDMDLVRLAITPSLNRHETPNQERLNFMQIMDEQYTIGQGAEDNSVLAFYGDIVLDVIVVDRMRNYFGLNTSKGLLSVIKESFIMNNTLTKIAKELGYCDDLAETSDFVPNSHNPCSESIEDVLGALFYSYGMEGFQRIKQWFFSLKPVDQLFDAAMITWYEGQQKKLVGSKYFPKHAFPLFASIEDFLDSYANVDDSLSIVMEPVPNSDTEYFGNLVNAYHDRAIHLGRFTSGDNEALKRALIRLGIWVLPEVPSEVAHSQTRSRSQYSLRPIGTRGGVNSARGSSGDRTGARGQSSRR